MTINLLSPALPSRVTHLDLSGSSFCIPNVDFTHHLPNLKTLHLQNCKLNYTDEKLWYLHLDSIKAFKVLNTTMAGHCLKVWRRCRSKARR